jgi:DNA invertase Pin-like site-specific DNA recombinase
MNAVIYARDSSDGQRKESIEGGERTNADYRKCITENGTSPLS